jgi:NAD(P)-dependent dehydrogenase (short-subunit alcohol dehydrogenase family)
VADKESRVVLLTGASGGLGEPLAEDLLAHGFVVAGVARSMKSSPRTDRFLPIEADLVATDGARDAVRSAIERAGRIDALVHALGGFAGGEDVAHTDDATWHRMIDLNLWAAFSVFREVLPRFLEAKRGRIVAIGSRVAVEPRAGLSAYGISKAGLVALVRTAALEVAGAGVTVNAILPSVIDTPQNRSMDPGADTSGWVKPSSIASCVRWLLSDGAADVNGAAIPMYGGA